MLRPKIQTSTGEDRFVNKDGHLVDREMHPKVLKAQQEAQKVRARKRERQEQRQRQ